MPLTDPELHFILLRGIQKLPASVLRDIQGAADARERGLDRAAKIMLAHFREAPHHVLPPVREDRPMADTRQR